MSNALQKLADATRMLAEIRSAKDPFRAKKLADQAAVAEHFAKKQKLGEEAIGYAHGIKIEALAILGEIRIIAPKPAGSRGQLKGRDLSGETLVVSPENLPPTREDLNLTRKEDEAAILLATIAAEQPEEFEKIKERQTTVTKVKRDRTRAKALKNRMEFPSGKFRVLYADPPWKYGDTLAGTLDGSYGGAERHYPTMTIAELSSLPVKEHSDENAVLFLWVTSPLLFECAAVFRAWGFAYKSAFIWDKVKHNMGHYNSVRHELLLICTRGSCTPDVNKLFDSVQSIERTDKHSQKPEEFRAIIDTLYPNGRRVELFARDVLPANWEAWGAEAVVGVSA